MQRVDINHDGVIQLTEFVAGLVDWKQLQNDTQWGHWVQVRGGGQPGTRMRRLQAGLLCRAAPALPPPLHAHLASPLVVTCALTLRRWRLTAWTATATAGCRWMS